MISKKDFFDKIPEMYNKYSLKPKKIEILNDDFIYHYTNILGIEGILKNKVFWLTKNDFMNDKLEMQYFWDLFNNIIKEYDNTFCKRLINYFDEENKLKNLIIPNDYFILSTSRNSDSHTLWSNYSEHYGLNIGISINIINGIKKNLLKDSANLLTYPNFENQIINKRLEHGYVIYDINNQKEIIKSEIEEYLKYYNEINEKDEKDLFVALFLERMIVYSLFYKDPYWKSEEEYRIVQFHSKQDEKFIKFRVSNDIIIPYVELDFSKYRNRIFNRITIGSKNKSDLTKKGLEYYLLKNDFLIKVKKASNPLQ